MSEIDKYPRGFRNRANVLIMAVSFTMAVYSGELYLTMDRLYFDTRTRPEVVENLRQRGLNAFAPVWPTLLLSPPSNNVALQPLGGIRKSWIPLGREAKNYAEVHLDRYGFNNPDHVWEQSSDVLMVGDSFAQEYAIPQEQSIAAVLSSKHG